MKTNITTGNYQVEVEVDTVAQVLEIISGLDRGQYVETPSTITAVAPRTHGGRYHRSRHNIPWKRHEVEMVFESVRDLGPSVRGAAMIAYKRLKGKLPGRTEQGVTSQAYRIWQYANGIPGGKHLSKDIKKMVDEFKAPVSQSTGFLGRIPVNEA